MASITDEELRLSIKEILKNADLSSLSAKKVRKQLEEKHGVDLTERKKEVDALVMELLTNGVESDHSDTEDSKKNGNKEDSVAEEIGDASDDEPEDEPPKKKVKPASKPIKPPPKKNKEIISKSEISDSDDDEDEKKDLNDEQVAKQLQDEENTYRSRSRAAKKPPKPQKERKKKEKSSESKGKYGKACLLSPELADIMGTDKKPGQCAKLVQMHRSDIVKRMWEIVRERNLQDPKNKQFMLCDDQLQKVFGKKRVRTFGMMKELKHHIKDEDAVAPR